MSQQGCGRGTARHLAIRHVPKRQRLAHSKTLRAVRKSLAFAPASCGALSNGVVSEQVLSPLGLVYL